MSTPVSDIEQSYRKESVPDFEVGDRVAVGVLIRELTKGAKGKEEEKTRIQQFIGDVIAISGKGLGRSFTVRRVTQGEGIERTFPVHSPLVTEIDVQRKGVVRRAKLYVLRKKTGKAARIKERQHSGSTKGRKATPKPTPAPEAPATEAAPADGGEAQDS